MQGIPDEEAVLRQLRRALVERDPAHERIASAALVWLGMNSGRIDARLRDAEGREHHVVAIADDEALTITLVLTEPDQVPVHPPVVVVVNGASGSGKSTLLRSIADDSDVPWVVLDEPVVGVTDQRILVWRERAPHVHAGFINGIAAVAAAGNAVAVAAGGHSQLQFRSSLKGLHAVYVGLDCPVELLLERERGRAGRWGGLALQSANAHDGWTYDIRIDSSKVTPLAAARSVLALLA